MHNPLAAYPNAWAKIERLQRETAEEQERRRAIAEWKPKLDVMREYILLKAEMRGE